MKLDQIGSGTSIFIDSTIFIYHFTGASADCRRLLERCETSDIKGFCSTVVLAEVAHRLMMIEAVINGFITGGNVARKLRGRPEVIKRLHLYQEQIEQVPMMGIEVEPLSTKCLLQSAALRNQYGLMVNDSLVATAALDLGLNDIASADKDFSRVKPLRVYCPSDLDA